MPDSINIEQTSAAPGKFSYGWVIVAACTLMLTVGYGLMYSYSVFFKPLADHFSWDRATVSFIYSVFTLIRGAASIGVGWAADKYGAKIVLVFGGVITGLGLVLSSQVQTLGQFFFTYGVLMAIGLSGAFSIATTIVARWFTRRRGMALGIVSMGSGFGTILVVPVVERLINAFAWSQTFIICGVAGGVIIVAGALLLRPPSQPDNQLEVKFASEEKTNKGPVMKTKNATFRQALHRPELVFILAIFFILIFCTQTVMVHLVNYATDIGVTPLIAATFLSIIGAVSIGGRFCTGLASDKIGPFNLLIITAILTTASFIILIFSGSIWSFYLFAVIFGFAYGADVPLVPLMVEKYFGTKSMATLMGLVMFVGNTGGALGPWLAGKIFDVTQTYHWVFIIGAIASALSLAPVLILKNRSQRVS